MNALSQESRVTEFVIPEKVTSGLDAVVDRTVGFFRRRRSLVLDLRAQAEKVDALEGAYRTLSDSVLKNRLEEYRRQFRRNGEAEQLPLLEALAAIREAAQRQLGLRPFTVQIMGALAMHGGFLTEMATGEGKTLTASLPAILAGWTRMPCHIVTVNDYLAQRDAEWLNPLYQFCGVSPGFVTGAMTPPERAHGYAQDVTYTTSKEIVADFLRDRLRMGEMLQPARRMLETVLHPTAGTGQGLVMRGLHTALVDEADSVLIDEAVTPLIISGHEGEGNMDKAYGRVWSLANSLEKGRDYRVDLRYKDVELLPPGKLKIESFGAEITGLWSGRTRKMELIKQALTAREFFQKGKQYVIHEGKIVIVDEFTGRMMPMRHWRGGLHQLIEAREGVEVSALDQTLARLSFQQFFRFFRKLSGMTGTGAEAAAEFWHVFKLPVIRIPVNKPCQRIEMADRIFPDATTKWEAIVQEIVRLHGQRRPILVGTRSIQASEMLAERLGELGLPFNLLNATRHKEEAQIVAEAGQEGRITIATNMAGRGTDIKLGKGVPQMGGLHVLATERHEARRIDRQLYGRAGRQGDPGSAQAFVSVEDELIRRFIAEPIRLRLQGVLKGKAPGAALLGKRAFDYAQRAAQRQAFRQRVQVLKMDTWLAESLSFAGSSNL